ncbi:hypothetical protein HGM15179_017029 [Zosterops borbonicus]|uniref:Uncharacterized protein n=1 Tax=Zosterops borbonicus TaxID=364589 RepID=A0A8K1G1M2_9PASS|nr:hypothetical protein HGM15179_017029 [Zosterops borbonicus]
MRAPGSRQAAALRRGKGFSGHWDQDQVRDRDQAMETETFVYPGHSAALSSVLEELMELGIPHGVIPCFSFTLGCCWISPELLALLESLI